MEKVTDRDGHQHLEATSKESRQARPGKPVLAVLVASLVILGLAGVVFMLTAG